MLLRYKLGIIFSIAFLVIGVFSFVEFLISYGKGDMGSLGQWIMFIFSPLAILLLVFANQFYDKLFVFFPGSPLAREAIVMFVFIIINSALFFAIGFILGILIEKIKRKKKGIS